MEANLLGEFELCPDLILEIELFVENKIVVINTVAIPALLSYTCGVIR